MFCRLATCLVLVFGIALNATAEEATVSDGLTISDWLVTATPGVPPSTPGAINNVEYTYILTNAFTTTNGSRNVKVNHTGHGKSDGDEFSIESGPTVDGLDLNGKWTVLSHNVNDYTFQHTGTASGGTSNTGSGQITFSDWQDDAKMRFLCFMSHSAYDDPIKNLGSAGSSHLHTFFGNTLADANSTYASLRAAGNGTCDGGPLNRTSYWFPSMINGNTNKLKYPVDMEWYYTNERRRHLTEFTHSVCTCGGAGQGYFQCNSAFGLQAACPQHAIRRLQRGQKAIFGFDVSGVSSGTPGTGGFPTLYYTNSMLDGTWRCHNTSGVQQGGGYRYLHNRDNASLGLTSNGSCPSDGYVVMRTQSPSCWDGQLDHDDHYSHFSFAINTGYGDTLCPTTHPYPHLQFLIILKWSYSGGISTVANWYLSSDRHNGADYEAGETFHWDMLFAWNDAVMDQWGANTFGMYPSPNSPPYIYDLGGGSGSNALGHTGDTYVGGKHMRNYNDGGLGIATIAPCTVFSGVALTTCALLSHTELGIGISDTEVDIPALRRRGRSKMR